MALDISNFSKPQEDPSELPGSVVLRTSSPIGYAASITPALPAQGDAVYTVGTLTGNIAIVTPSGTPVDGQVIRFRFQQDGTGGRTVTFDSGYAFGTDVTAALIPSTASAKWVLLFSYDGTSATWRALSIARGF